MDTAGTRSPGVYTAHQALAAEDLAFVLFLGDYIYEGRPNPAALRQHDGTGEPVTLDEYRARHARYRGDADLQSAHAAFPWIVTYDDHELDNNWADEIPQDPALLCDLDRRRWLTDLRTVDTVTAPRASVSTFAQFVTEAGVRGVSVA